MKSTLQIYNLKNDNCHLQPFIILEYKTYFTKILAVAESSIKIKVRLHWTLFVILLTSTVICKQRLLHENEIIAKLIDARCTSKFQGHFRKPL